MMPAAHASIRTLSDLFAGQISVPAAHNIRITGLCSDSRKLQTGEVFFAVRGLREDGQQYVSEALARGASAVIGEGDAVSIKRNGAAVSISLPKLHERLGELAANYYQQPARALTVIGVTGTNGKSTVTHLLAQAWNHLQAKRSAVVIGTLGNGDPQQLTAATHTTPEALALQSLFAQFRNQHKQLVALEVSSHALDQARVNGTHFAAAVFTNLTRDHLDYHGSMADYAAAKRKLFAWADLPAAVINVDDDFGKSLLTDPLAGSQTQVITYSLQQRADLTASIVSMTEGLQLQVDYAGEQVALPSPLLGRFNAYNLLSALAALLSQAVPLSRAAQALSTVTAVAGRMQQLGGGTQPRVIVDYAHTPDALEKLLTAVREFTRGKLCCVFGCGGNRDSGKRPQMGAVAARLADQVILTSDNPRDEDPLAIIHAIGAGIPASVHCQIEADRRRAIVIAIAQAQAADVVVLAGKGHESYQEVRGQRWAFDDVVEARRALSTWEQRP